MERPIERYLGGSVAIETLANVLRKNTNELEEKFLHIAHSAALQMHLKGYASNVDVIEAIFQVTDDSFEALLFTAVCSEPLLFSAHVVKNMMTFIPQYRAALNLPVPKTWSMDHLTFIRVEKAKAVSDLESQLFEESHREVRGALTDYLEDIASDQKLHRVQDVVMQMSHRQVAASAILMF